VEVLTSIFELFLIIVVTFWTFAPTIEFDVTHHGNVIENENVTTDQDKPVKIKL